MSTVHNSSIIAFTATFNEANVIMPGEVVQSMRKRVICNTFAVIEHECKIGNFCQNAPGAVLADTVFLRDRIFVGANSVI